MVSHEMKKVIEQLRLNAKNIGDGDTTLQDMRNNMEKFGYWLGRPENLRCNMIDAGGIGGAWVWVDDDDDIFNDNNSNNDFYNDDNVILYLHGGAFVMGSIETHMGICASVSKASKTKVLMVDYRLAPENCFPAAIEDAAKVYRWLVSDYRNKLGNPIHCRNVIIAGDSAGGGLVISTLLKLRDEGDQLPAAAICLSPWTDLTLCGNSCQSKSAEDPMLTLEELSSFAKCYIGGSSLRNPLASPLFADLSGLPPFLVQVGTSELLLDDSLRFSEKARSEGVDVQLEVWEDMIHVFSAFLSVPESLEAIKQISGFIDKHFVST